MKLVKRKKDIKTKEKKKKEESRPQYCSVIKDRLPFPIECSTNKKLGNKICHKCDRVLEYSLWKNGEYNDLILKYNR